MSRYRCMYKIVLFLVLLLSLAACGGSAGATQTATPATTDNQPGTGPHGLPLYCPLSVAVNAQDTVLVSDNDQNTGHERLLLLSTSGQEMGEWHVFKAGPIGQTQGPGNAAFDAQGNLYVIDLRQNAIVKVSPAGHILTSWGTYGSGPGQFQGPGGIVVDAHGTVYVGDNDGNTARVEKFSTTGTYLGTLPVALKPGPIGLAVDSNDNLYVANDQYLTRLSPTGEVLGHLQTAGNTTEATSVLTGATYNTRGDLYVVNVLIPQFGNRSTAIWKLDSTTGKVLANWQVGKAGIKDVTSIATDSQGNVYTTETTQSGATQLQKFATTGAVLATWKGACSSS